MRKLVEGIACYLSCMVLFNVVYALSIIADVYALEKNLKQWDFIVLITLGLSVLLAIIGIIFTIIIVGINDEEKNEATTGKQFEVVTVKDLTVENYFANFSVIVLTGIALPSRPNGWSLAIFLLVEIALGVVYVKKNLFYMNPVLSLLDYSIYECTGKDCLTQVPYEGKYIFMTKNIIVKEKRIIKYKNINSRIIWIKN